MDAAKKGGSNIAPMIWTVCSPIIFVLGVVGNILTILVLNRQSKKSSTTIYLTGLATVDLTHILIGIPRWWVIYNFKYDIRHSSAFVCKIQFWLLYSSGLMSSLYLVFLTCERVLSISRPHKVRTICSIRNSVLVCVISTAVALVLHSHILYGFDLEYKTIGVEGIGSGNMSLEMDGTDSNATMADYDKELNETVTVPQCTYTSNILYKAFFEGVQGTVVFISAFLFPQVFCLVGGIFIIWNLIKNNRIRKSLNQTGRPRHDNRTNQVTRMLLTVNAVFLILNTPVQVYLAGIPYWVGSQMTTLQEIIWAIVNMFHFLNNAVNFILYFLSGSRFRKSFFDFIKCRKEVGAYVPRSMNISSVLSGESGTIEDNNKHSYVHTTLT